MDELIKQITQRTPLNAAQAAQVVEMVVGFLKERLPAPMAAQVDTLLAGGGSALGGAMDMLGNLGGMFGGERKS